jgi:Rab proteins geranylgeranyltransferase component A
LACLNDDATPEVLWSVYYWRNETPALPVDLDKEELRNISLFSHPSLDLAFDDTVFDRVREVWARIIGKKATDEEFLSFEDREGEIEEDEDN